MEVVVHLHTILQRKGPDGSISRLVVEMPSDSDLAALLRLINIHIDPEELLLVVNTRTARPEQVLCEGDEVHLIPALSGGGLPKTGDEAGLENHWVVQAKGITKTYRQNRPRVDALRGIDLEVPAGAYTVILGPSGGGKSTLLHLLGGIDRPSSGSLHVLGLCLDTASEVQLTRFRRDHIGFIFQFYNLIPSINALDNIILPLLAKDWSWKQARKRGLAIMEQVGLLGREKHKPAELSGGEQQRVAIARALIVEPGLILADEPTGDLDSTSAGEVVDLMRRLNQELATTFIIVTHNRDLCKDATVIYEMRDGLLHLSAP